MPPATPSLLGLPREIRDMIYGYLAQDQITFLKQPPEREREPTDITAGGPHSHALMQLMQFQQFLHAIEGDLPKRRDEVRRDVNMTRFERNLRTYGVFAMTAFEGIPLTNVLQVNSQIKIECLEGLHQQLTFTCVPPLAVPELGLPADLLRNVKCVTFYLRHRLCAKFHYGWAELLRNLEEAVAFLCAKAPALAILRIAMKGVEPSDACFSSALDDTASVGLAGIFNQLGPLPLVQGVHTAYLGDQSEFHQLRQDYLYPLYFCLYGRRSEIKATDFWSAVEARSYQGVSCEVIPEGCLEKAKHTEDPVRKAALLHGFPQWIEERFV